MCVSVMPGRRPAHAALRHGLDMSGLDTCRSMPSGFMLLIAAQFVSALADNALLILTIAALDALIEQR